VAWLGFFYGGNIAGAVAGCLLAGFYLLRVYDMQIATYVAVAINVAVAALAYVVSATTPFEQAERKAIAAALDKSAPATWTIYLAIAISGCCALGAEVIWTRLLSLLLGGTVYTFSLILAVFLVGLGLGSSAGSLAAKSTSQPRAALAACQFLLAAAVAWAAWQLSRSLPYWPIDVGLARDPWHVLQLDLVRCAWVLLPAAVLWGASFPLALASVADPAADAGRLVGRVYAANTIGAILGAVAFSVLVVRWAGTQDAQRLLVVFSALAALVAVVPALWPHRRPHAPREESLSRSEMAMVWAWAVAGALCAAVALAWTIPPASSDLIAYGRSAALQTGRGKVIYQGEGMNSSVAVTLLDSGARNFHVSGKIEASSEPQDMRLQRMLGHIPALLHPEPKSVLVVGCGAGVTAGSFVVHPSVERIVICEIEPLIPQVVAKHFALENYKVVEDRRVEIVYDDARHYILTTDEKFDIITSDPIHPWVKGAATLYTEEYFELCKSRLHPGGVVTQWVPLYESHPAAVKSELATFFRVFPSATVWSNDIQGVGYDVVLLGQSEPRTIHVEALQAQLDRDDHAAVWISLQGVGFESALDLLSTYAAQASDLKPWLRDAEINRDRNLRLQYLAGLGLNSYREGAIFSDLASYRQYPDNLFVVSTGNLPILKRRLRFK
jgi:spermidine synthase